MIFSLYKNYSLTPYSLSRHCEMSFSLKKSDYRALLRHLGGVLSRCVITYLKIKNKPMGT
jgi:hypothetical protein